MLLVALGISYLINNYAHKSIVSNAVTNNFIYQFLLPIIVLAEGFNNRKKSFGYYRREIISYGLMMPVICFATYAGILGGLQWLIIRKMGLFYDYR